MSTRTKIMTAARLSVEEDLFFSKAPNRYAFLKHRQRAARWKALWDRWQRKRALEQQEEAQRMRTNHPVLADLMDSMRPSAGPRWGNW